MKPKKPEKPLTYADAGVDLSAWRDTKKRIGGLVKSTYTDKVVGKFGQFGGLFDVSLLKKFTRPILVSSVDGVGTKLKIAFATGKHDTVGEDIVNHCINDILVLGAQPLFFLDYLGTGRLSPEVVEKVMLGLTRACKASACVLIGGETAEMPGFYQEGEYDIAGTIVGIVDEHRVIDGSAIAPGDVLIGLRSNGLHTNGYSLARTIVTEIAGKDYADTFAPTGRTFGEELLRPHRAYSAARVLMDKDLIKGCAHITGGGFQENVDRILPQHCDAVIDTKRWSPDEIFVFLQTEGRVENDEMYRTFNMGMGMVLVVSGEHADEVLNAKALASFGPARIGAVRPGEGRVVMEY
ncbi:MAG: phosphoribosylformylglycinamidine cyclo-ligase [Chitinivibrionales bacterium]|nr:phosphoribosylformylglycinamidine cyclo-ligase [Chitinivibrionales bacterium]MBD3395755.1 phosphoribosylformylglycinamidine cyclo-ligase [Chitinivibrionales bacterium]